MIPVLGLRLENHARTSPEASGISQAMDKSTDMGNGLFSIGDRSWSCKASFLETRETCIHT